MNPFDAPVDFNDARVMKQANELYLSLEKRRPSLKETARKLITLEGKKGKMLLMFDDMSDNILALQVEMILWQKYLEIKQQEEEQARAEDAQLNEIRVAQLKLQQQEKELKAKRITTRKVIRNSACELAIEPVIEVIEVNIHIHTHTHARHAYTHTHSRRTLAPSKCKSLSWI
jgi:SpoU rRNA methylase family enzyme